MKDSSNRRRHSRWRFEAGPKAAGIVSECKPPRSHVRSAAGGYDETSFARSARAASAYYMSWNSELLVHIN